MLTNYYHHPWAIKLRTVARKVGVLSVVKSVVSKRQSSYELAFVNALRSAVKESDTIWDVGAHVGVYTNQFLDWTGDGGVVVAFEPLPKAFAELEKNVGGRTNAVLIPKALSSAAGEAVFAIDVEEGVTMNAHIADGNEAGIRVSVATADEIVAAGTPRPNVVKIDVEGYEEDVLIGGKQTFSHADCRHLLIEMHFTRMSERGIGDSASRIVRLLKDWNYKIKWVDASHLHASR